MTNIIIIKNIYINIDNIKIFIIKIFSIYLANYLSFVSNISFILK